MSNYCTQDFAKMPSYKQRMRRKKIQKIKDDIIGWATVILFCMLYGFAGHLEYQDLERVEAKSNTPVVEVQKAEVSEIKPEPTKVAVIETPKVEVKAVEVPKCDLTFRDVRATREINITPPAWFSDMFQENGITNCAKQRWMSQIAFYESEYCKGDINNCSNVVGAANDTGLFQYIPSTWADPTNPEHKNPITDARAQFRAVSIKYDKGGQGIWTTNKYTR